jgi:hypothetical protein
MASDQAQSPSTARCYVCSSPAQQPCEQCHRPICATHTLNLPRMSWQHFGNSRGSWRQYLPEPGASPWQVCPTCAADIQGHDAHEQAVYRRELWLKWVIVLVMIVFVISCCALFQYLATH